MSNFHGAMSNFRGEATNFRGAMSNFRGEASGDCGEATGGNQWPLHKWIYYRNEVNTHILVTHRRSQKKIATIFFGCIRFFSYLCSHHCVSITVT